MCDIKKIFVGFMLMLALAPAGSRAQQGHNVGPIDSVAWYASSDIACDMIRVIQAKTDSFKSMKGEFYLTDEQGNNYYNAIGLGMFTESKYVDVKVSGQVAFVARWLNTGGDHGPMYALDAFTVFMGRVPEGKPYELAPKPVTDPATSEVTYTLKERGSEGRAVARFMYNRLLRSAVFIVD